VPVPVFKLAIDDQFLNQLSDPLECDVDSMHDVHVLPDLVERSHVAVVVSLELDYGVINGFLVFGFISHPTPITLPPAVGVNLPVANFLMYPLVHNHVMDFVSLLVGPPVNPPPSNPFCFKIVPVL